MIKTRIAAILTALMLTLILFNLSACAYQQTSSQKTNISSISEQDKKIKINLATICESESLKSIINEFERQNSGIEVSVKEYPMPGDITYDKYVKSVNTEIFSNSAADIISVQGLPVRDYIKKGVLLNLDSYINKSGEYNNSNYVMNIIDGCKFDNIHYLMPVSFSFQIFAADKNAVKNISLPVNQQFITWKDFYKNCGELYKYNNSQPYIPQTIPVPLYKILTRSIYEEFIALDKKSSDLQNKEFIKLLNSTKELNHLYIDSKITNTSVTSQFTAEGMLIMPYTILDILDFLKLKGIFNNEIEYLSFPKLRESSENRFNPIEVYGINSSTDHPDAAWKFLYFMLTKEMQANVAGLPVNRALLNEKIDTFFGDNKIVSIKAGDKEKAVKGLSDMEKGRIITMINGLNKVDCFDSSIDNIVLEGLEDYFKGNKPANTAIKSIQDRLNIYLYE